MYNAVKVMMEMDQRLYAECNEQWIRKGENYEQRQTDAHHAFFRKMNRHAMKNPLVIPWLLDYNRSFAVF